LLAAILFPVFARARENARRSSCQSNLKQIGLGFAQYVQDNDGTYPAAYYATANGQIGWAQVIQPYLKSIQIYQCPSESYRQNPFIKDVSAGNYSYAWFDYTDYAYNQNFTRSYEPYGTNALSNTPLRDSQLAGAALTVLLGDSVNDYQAATFVEPTALGSSEYHFDSNGDYVYTPGAAYNAPPMAMQRHFDGANYAFADGHVKWLKHTAVSRGYSGLFPQADGWSQPYPNTAPSNAMPPSKLTAPYSATFSPVDYF
jgi:prepilin-type processing-associated H-X9-DG protein